MSFAGLFKKFFLKKREAIRLVCETNKKINHYNGHLYLQTNIFVGSKVFDFVCNAYVLQQVIVSL